LLLDCEWQDKVCYPAKSSADKRNYFLAGENILPLSSMTIPTAASFLINV